MDARAAGALKRFGDWCMWRSAGWWSHDVAWMACHYFGARQIKNEIVEKWSRPVLDAHLAGAWFLIWTGQTLYWVPQPIVRTTPMRGAANGRVLHCEDGPAIECDIDNLYFLRGLMVPADVVLTPHLLTVKDIDGEKNNDVRAVMLERFGVGRYLLESGASVIDEGKNNIEGTHEALMVAPNGRRYFWPTCPSGRVCPPLPVPDEINTREQARNWLAGSKPFRILART